MKYITDIDESERRLEVQKKENKKKENKENIIIIRIPKREKNINNKNGGIYNAHRLISITKNLIKDKLYKYRNIFKFICIFICFMTILALYIHLPHKNKNVNINDISNPIFKPSTPPLPLDSPSTSTLSSPSTSLSTPPQPLLNIYISTHKDFVNILTSPVYKILCDEKSQLKQEYNLPIIETNQNNILFPKNRGYSEGSKMYYIWNLYKEGKLNSKYVGFNHYRRIFTFKDDIPDLDEIFKNYDVILKRRFNFRETVREQYNYCHIAHFLNECVDIISENYSEYYQYAISALGKKWGNYCNIFIMKKEDFIKWGEFVFGVLLEFDRRYNLTTDEDIRKLIIKEAKTKRLNINYQSRLESFLLERIGIIFYESHFKKVYEIDTKI